MDSSLTRSTCVTMALYPDNKLSQTLSGRSLIERSTRDPGGDGWKSVGSIDPGIIVNVER